MNLRADTATHLPPWTAERLEQLDRIGSTTHALAAIGREIIINGELSGRFNASQLDAILAAIELINRDELAKEALDPLYPEKLVARVESELAVERREYEGQEHEH